VQTFQYTILMPRGHEHHSRVEAESSEDALALVHAIHPDSRILRFSRAEQESAGGESGLLHQRRFERLVFSGRELVHQFNKKSFLPRLEGVLAQTMARFSFLPKSLASAQDHTSKAPADALSAIPAFRPLAVPSMLRRLARFDAGAVIWFLFGIVLTSASIAIYERSDLFGCSVYGSWVSPDPPSSYIDIFEDGMLQLSGQIDNGTRKRIIGRVVRLGRGRYRADLGKGDNVVCLRLTLIGDQLISLDPDGSPMREWRRTKR